MPDIAQLTFAGERRPDVAEIGHFMFLYRAAYTASLRELGSRDLRGWPDRLEALESRVCTRLRSLDVEELGELFSAELGSQAVSVSHVAVRSPLEIVLAGVGAALALAVIISGGTLKFNAATGAIEAALPPLGEGIEKLMEAMATRANVDLGYGVRARRVKLSRGEFDELMKFDPRTEKRGGFQRVLIGMQYRVNRTTRELDLSEHDISVIMKHGRQPKRGGWQSSIRKIFWRHFDLDSDA